MLNILGVRSSTLPPGISLYHMHRMGGHHLFCHCFSPQVYHRYRDIHYAAYHLFRLCLSLVPG